MQKATRKGGGSGEVSEGVDGGFLLGRFRFEGHADRFRGNKGLLRVARAHVAAVARQKKRKKKSEQLNDSLSLPPPGFRLA